MRISAWSSFVLPGRLKVRELFPPENGSRLTAATRSTPGHSRHALHDLLIKLELAIFVGFRGRAYIKYEEPIGIEAGGDFRQVREALDHQAGADQQDERQADFGGDEERATPAAAAGAAAFALFQ